MNALLIGYIVLYALGSTLLFIAHWRLVPAAEKADEAAWETPVDILLAAVGLVGMLLLLFDVESVAIKMLWRPVSVALVAAQLWLNLAARRKWKASAEAPDTLEEARQTDAGTLVLLAPALLLNLIYAFR